MYIVLGIIWFVSFYALVAYKLHQAQKNLKNEELGALAQARRTFIPVAVVLLAVLLGGMAKIPHLLWLVLPSIGVIAISFVFWTFSKVQLLPSNFVLTYRNCSILYSIGVIGFGVALGFQSGFNLV